MGSIRSRGKLLFFDFRYQGTRCREQTLLEDNPTNRKKLESFMVQIDREIQQGTFQYEKYFPDSSNADRFSDRASAAPVQKKHRTSHSATPLFKDFAQEWYQENEIAWKISYQKTVKGTIDRHLIPAIGEEEVSRITKGDILKFRSTLAKVSNGSKEGLSPDRINHIMTPLRMILNDAADRFHFTTPYVGIKSLKVPKTEVEPFTLEEVNLFIAKVRADYRDYYIVRFFTAMRTGEIDGLQWKYVDFDRHQILIRETLVEGRIETPKTPGSIRVIQMSTMVEEALLRQRKLTGELRQNDLCQKKFNSSCTPSLFARTAQDLSNPSTAASSICSFKPLPPTIVTPKGHLVYV